VTPRLRPQRCLIGWSVLAALLSTAPPLVAQDANDPSTRRDDWAWYAQPTPPADTAVIGSVDPASGYLMQVRLTTLGAGVEQLQLTNYFATVADTQLWRDVKDEGGHEAYVEKVRAEPETYQGHYSLMRRITAAGESVVPYATHWVDIAWQKDSPRTPLFQTGLDRSRWELLEHDANHAVFVYTFYFGPPGDWSKARNYPAVRLRKTFRLEKNSYSLKVDLALENLTEAELVLGVNQFGATGLDREGVRTDYRRAGFGRLTPAQQSVEPIFKGQGELDDVPPGEAQDLGATWEAEPIVWAGGSNKFFGSFMHPVGDANDLTARAHRGMFYWQTVASDEGVLLPLVGLRLAEIDVPAGGSETVKLDVYAGPKKRSVFTSASDPAHRPLYQRLNYLSTLEFRSCICAWDALAIGMMWLLEKLWLISWHNYGVAIMLLVFITRLCLHPLTKKGQVSMMGMQKLAPRMKEIQEKYKDDKDAQQREIMALYRQHGVGPFLGCLPMFVQMPIWIALWTSINASVELRHAAFLPFWLTDLAAPDSLMTWSAELPLISWLTGNRLNLLPLLLAVAMYLQAKLNPQMSGASAAQTPEQEQTQKMMRLMMPAMMLLIFYQMPSGLNLYIMTSTFAGVLEQKMIRKHIKERQEAEKAGEVKVQAPGKQSRHARPKKPKGPFWHKQG
jgi:YidC/Oxa1 family membrane protein insertase